MDEPDISGPMTAAIPSTALAEFVYPLLDLIGQLTGMESTYLTRIDLDRQEQEILLARNQGELKLDEGLVVPWRDTLCRRALESGQQSTDNVARTWPDATTAIELGLTSLVTLPVTRANGQLWGTLCSASARPLEPDSAALTIMQACSRLISQQIELVQRAHQAEQSLGRMALVAEASQICLDADSLASAIESIAGLLENLSPWQTVLPFRLEGDQPRLPNPPGPEPERLVRALIQLLGDAVPRRHDHRHSPLLAENELDETVQTLRQALGLSPIGPTGLLTAATPNQLQAGIVVLADQSVALEERDEKMLISCSNALSLLADRLFQHGRLEADNLQLSEEAGHDALTGLPNRRRLIERLEQLTQGLDRQHQQLLLAFVDLDGFKKLNDQHGHEAGDLFLISVAQRLKSGLRGDDWVARLGGDEFVVLTIAGRERDPEDIARHLGERIDQAITGSHDLGTMRINYGGASVGVVSWQGELATELLNRADQAMYAAKSKRRGHA